ncbi:MAG: VCBS repeat-containing protein [Bacteroidales bacterium]|nr:VCBS repeat-containing protein [Bacteroidales bacterium]
MIRHTSLDSLLPVAIPASADTLNIKSVRTKVSLDPNNLPFVLSEDEKSWLNDEFFKSQMAGEEAWWKEFEKQPKLRAVNTTYSVGSIPLQEGVSPTGARTYNLPIPTAAGFKLVPNISLAYNSQSAEGWAGYGWDIQGISCIKLINKNTYYHGEIKAADVNASAGKVFALDGNPLVRNEHPETKTTYPLESARGHILVREEYINGKIGRFRALYPNGITAVFGHGTTSEYAHAYYYLTELHDIEGNKIVFDYDLDGVAGYDRILSIRYGYDDSDNYSGEIVFNYDSWIDAPLRYYAGVEYGNGYRLTSIESRSDGEVLYTYNFSYQQSGPLWLLNHIDRTSGSASLPPVEFTYASVPTSQYLKKDNQSITLPATYFSAILPILYKRGKFTSGDFRDGILIYPGYPTYERVWDSDYNIWRYGPFAPEDKQIIFIPRLENNLQFNLSLVFEKGFQSIDAVDVDGDGADEIVKINLLEGVFGDKTRVSITTYKCNDDGYPMWINSFIVSLNGVHSDHSPYNRKYYWGDFNGDGKCDLLAIAPSKDIAADYGRDQTCYAAIIDYESQTVLSDEYLFYLPQSGDPDSPYDWDKCLIVNDIDNDGRTELCHADSNGLRIYRLLDNGHFALEKTLPDLTYTILCSRFRPCYFADINGDGYIDIIRTPSSNASYSWEVYYYNGNSFTVGLVGLNPSSSFTNAVFIDVNRDGMADMVTINETSDTTATLGCRVNLNGYSFSFYQESPNNVKNAKGIVPVNVSAYNRPSAFIKFDGRTVYNYSYQGITSASRHITMAVDSYGKRLRSSYTYLPTNAPTWTDTSLTVNNSQGYAFQTLPIYVLSSEYSYLSSSASSFYDVNQYEYYNGVAHKRGLGFCGFSKIRKRVMVNVAQQNVIHDVADSYYDAEKMGVLTKVERKKITGSTSETYYTLTNTWSDHSTTYGKLNPRLSQSVTSDDLTGVISGTNYYYDSWDYPTEILEEKHFSGQNNSQRERRTYSYQHSNTSTKYVLGSVTNEFTWLDLDGQLYRQWKNKVLTTYDANFHPLTRKSYTGLSKCVPTNPQYEISDSTLLAGETRWTYDSHGNVLTEKSASYDATEFIGHTYTYDANGRYMLTDTDALGHTTHYVNYNKFGKPGRVDDYRGRNTYYSYDPWGRVITVRRIDGSVEYTTYAWGGTGVYTVTKTEAYGGPSSITHYDALDREVRSGNKRFDAQWQYTDTKYNRYGQVSQTSLPFREAEPAYWNTYTYDNYDLPIKILEPSGKETTWSYSGTSVTTVKDGIVSVSTKDPSGNVVSVLDDGGTITYTLRDDGQPSKVTAPGNVETTFTYDGYGRRTGITDPSAGTRTEAYVWNADGSHEQTHTGPNGSITTSWDKYGRTTSVVRPGEFNTTYSYNTYGLLSSEQSTNGTGTEYTYDYNDRVSTVKEIVPDGKWLKKTYTYGSWGNLSTVKYTTHDGDITTETYSYANGCNTGSSITDGTTVWTLVSENDLGQPTQITTGSTSRQYGFTEYGLPAYRKMAGGSLQNFTYQINVNNGNLTSRTDVINNKTESFKYDVLNRLDTLGTRVAQYANNGNILSLTSVGSMSYANTGKPYQVSSYTPVYSGLVPSRTQDISYNSLDRPSLLEEGSKTAAFTYNAVGDRVRMQITDGLTQELTRYYIGGQYECDVTSSGTKERLYLGGDAYSAPMVYQRVNNGSWTAYNIGRDYLGSVTHIATTSGTLVAEYSYDPWGRLRNPAIQAIYTPGTEPALFLGRGYTGHEHLTWFGLINMNARLYDPLLGRFLSPDPYVQAPDFTQNFNRYSYALNNPLKYRDPNGEFAFTTLFWVACFSAAVFGAGNVAAHAIRGEDLSSGKWIEYLMTGSLAGFAVGALGYAGVSGMTALAGMSGFWGGVGKTLLYGTIGTGLAKTGATITSFVGGKGLANAGKIFLGNFYLDENKSFWGQVGEGILRHTWEAPQQALGYFWSSARNTVGAVDRVDYLGGATYATREYSDGSGISFGSFLNINDTGAVTGTFEEYATHNPLYMHEYGHYIDSQRFGPAYLLAIGVPSAISASSDEKIGYLWAHSYYWTETRANNNASSYFGTHYGVNWLSDTFHGKTYASLYPL